MSLQTLGPRDRRVQHGMHDCYPPASALVTAVLAGRHRTSRTLRTQCTPAREISVSTRATAGQPETSSGAQARPSTSLQWPLGHRQAPPDPAGNVPEPAGPRHRQQHPEHRASDAGEGAARRRQLATVDHRRLHLVLCRPAHSRGCTGRPLRPADFADRGADCFRARQRDGCVLYERALDRCNTVLSTNVKLNIHEKKAEIERQKAILVAAAIRAVRDRLDPNEEQRRLAPLVVKQEMLALSAEVS